MNNMKTLAAAILLVVSTAVWAQSTDEQSEQTDPAETTMGGPGQMMSPEMRQQMMQHGWGHRMMGPQTMGQWMPHQQMPHMPMMNYSPMYPMMPHMPGMGHGMGHPKMFEQHQQHMAEMRQTLKNIESLLQQILEQQKSL
ncbi:MAG: hypothetical protein OEU50_15435 [Gammaproteobacteria bacterium]|nr:hypothetical protein [Gammaproteobacteria bacterium]